MYRPFNHLNIIIKDLILSPLTKNAVRSLTIGTSVSLAKKVAPFTYQREKKTPSIFTSGDNGELEPIDLSRPVKEFENCKDLEKADPIVKKLISLEFAPVRETTKVQRWDYIKRVQRHPLDTGSSESKVATLTVKIRHLQQVMRENPQAVSTQVYLNEAIDRRKRLLKNLRKTDYLRFEWLIDLLNITYRPPPLFYHWTTRKGTLRNLTREHCVKLRKTKIDAFRAKLKSQQAAFLDEREQTLKWIAEQQKRLDLTPEELDEIERRQMPFKIPVFPKHYYYKNLIPPHLIQYFPPE